MRQQPSLRVICCTHVYFCFGSLRPDVPTSPEAEVQRSEIRRRYVTNIIAAFISLLLCGYFGAFFQANEIRMDEGDMYEPEVITFVAPKKSGWLKKKSTGESCSSSLLSHLLLLPIFSWTSWRTLGCVG